MRFYSTIQFFPNFKARYCSHRRPKDKKPSAFVSSDDTIFQSLSQVLIVLKQYAPT